MTVEKIEQIKEMHKSFNVIWKILLNINLKRMGMNDEILRK